MVVSHWVSFKSKHHKSFSLNNMFCTFLCYLVYGSGFHFRSFEVQSTRNPTLFFIIRILYFFNLLGIPIESLYVQTNITKNAQGQGSRFGIRLHWWDLFPKLMARHLFGSSLVICDVKYKCNKIH